MVSAAKSAPRSGARDCRTSVCQSGCAKCWPISRRRHDRMSGRRESPWLAVREWKRIDLIFFYKRYRSRRSANSQTCSKHPRSFSRIIVARVAPLTLVGRKCRDFYRRRGAKILAEHINLPVRPSYQDAAGIAREVIRQLSGWPDHDAVFVLNNEFKSVMSQRLSVMQLLPVDTGETKPGETKEVKDYIYEQSPVDMLDRLMPRYVEVAVFRAMLETIASYQAARMTAMDKASSNARDVIDTLTLNMNRIRQAAITKEIIEVVSGAAAAAR